MERVDKKIARRFAPRDFFVFFLKSYLCEYQFKTCLQVKQTMETKTTKENKQTKKTTQKTVWFLLPRGGLRVEIKLKMIANRIPAHW